MDWLLGIVAIFAVLGLGYTGVPAWVWSSISAFILFLFTRYEALSLPVLFVLWALWLVAFAFLHVYSIRSRFFTKHVARFVKDQLPPISDTEQAAIDAGDVWWDAALMRGLQDWHQIASFKLSALTSEELNFLEQQTTTLCGLVDKWKQDNVRHHSEAVWSFIKKEHFFSMIIPKEYGGLGFSAYAQSCVLTKIASKDISTAVTVMVPNSLGPAELLLHYGTPEQRQHYLPRLADGTDIPCFALTSPEAGSDAGGMIDVGVVVEGIHDGQKVLGISLNFDKRYITLAPVATVVGLAFKCFDPNKLLGGDVDCGITLCLLPSNHPGLEIGDCHFPIGGAFPNGPLRGKDVFIPMDWVIGGKAKIGQGWRMLMECLSAGRGISLPALSTATSKIAFASTASYARVRKQFKVSIGEFEGVQAGMAEIGGIAVILEAMRSITTSAISQGIKPSVISAIAKYHMTELARISATHAMDIHGGKGIILGPSNYLANLYTCMPVAITVEGANILTRNLIIFGQGAIRCHPYLLKEMTLAAASSLDLPAFDRVLRDHIHFTLERFFKTALLGLTGGRLVHAARELPFLREQQAIARMSDALAFVSDITFLMLGGKLKRKEFLSARLGDVLSFLYMGTCVIKYASTHPETYNKSTQYALKYCLQHIQQAFEDFFDNFPQKWIGQCLKWIVFPLGRSYLAPSDTLSQQVTHEMMATSIDGSFWQTFYHGGESDPLGVVIAAAQLDLSMHDQLRLLRKIDGENGLPLSLRDKVNAALQSRVITESDHQTLLRYCDLYEQSIQVDAFHS